MRLRTRVLCAEMSETEEEVSLRDMERQENEERASLVRDSVRPRAA